MKPRTTFLAFAGAISVLAGSGDALVFREPPQTLYYIPHTHWEGAVFFTREEYLDQGLPHILTALRMLEKYPEYHFTLDQVAYFKPFLERYPEAAANFRKYIAEGRLHIVGGMDVMPDVVKPGGELFVRQMQYGKGYCRKELGIDVDVAWLVDTFGHHPQMPQLLAQAGFKSFWFCRGVPKDEIPSEFFWRGIDGTKIPAFWVPGFYGLFFGPPREQAGFNTFFEDRYNALNIHVRDPERVGLAGVDVCNPEQDLAPLVAMFNQRPQTPFAIKFAGPEDFAKVVAKRTDVPTMDGDFNPIFQGTYSSRVELRQSCRRIERSLLNAETLSAACASLGTGQAMDEASLWQAWEPLLFNQTHDLASGVMTDIVYEDTVKSDAFSERLADGMIDSAWDRLAAQIDTRGDGVPVVVFNPQGWKRTDSIQVDVGVMDPTARDLVVVDSTGKQIQSQIVSSRSNADGSLGQARICFVAEDVPAIGYCTYRVIAKSAAAAPEQPGQSGDSIENEFFKVAINLKSGQITSIIDKSTGKEVLAAPGNTIARQEDNGDLWELYHHLNGAMYIAATDTQAVPDAKTSILSDSSPGEDGQIERGGVFSEFSVAHGLGNGKVSTRIRLTRGIARIDIETTLLNNERHVRYQVLFPTVIRNGHNFQEIPFGAVERPMGVEYPAQNWVDLGDGSGSAGIGLLNEGLPGNLVTDGTMMLSLLRSESLLDYNFGRPSETGFELGVPRTLRYAIVPHGGDWRAAGMPRRGIEFNSPLLVRKPGVHAGKLPGRMGLLEISDPGVVLTAFKPGPEGSTIVRFYESTGREAKGVAIKLHPAIKSAKVANLLEDPGRELPFAGNAVKVDLHPFEILTLRLVLTPG